MIEINGKTDKGLVRSNNEDQLGIWVHTPELGNQLVTSFTWEDDSPTKVLFAVADGMGGTDKGEFASQTSIESLDALVKKINLDSSQHKVELFHVFQKINKILWESQINSQNNENCGTTLTICHHFEDKLQIYWVGDSRVYQLRNNQLDFLLNEHTWVWESYLKGEIELDQIKDHPKSHIITKCLGLADYIDEPDFNSLVLKKGDRILACSDGVNSMLSHEQIKNILANTEKPEQAVDQLIASAKSQGGKDNITAIIFDYYPEERPSADDVTPIVSNPNTKPKKTYLPITILVTGLIAISAYFLFSTNLQQQNCITVYNKNVAEFMKNKEYFESNRNNIIGFLDDSMDCIQNNYSNDAERVELINSDIKVVKNMISNYKSSNTEFQNLHSAFEQLEYSLTYLSEQHEK